MGNNQKDVVEKNSTHHTRCRVCGKETLTPYLDLGNMPLANNLPNTKEEALAMDRFPLKVVFCDNCSLSQLSEVVDPRLLFSNYFYRSAMSKTYVNHCAEMAKSFHKKYNLTPAVSFIIDIAGNDGTLLLEFKKELPGVKVLNIDPAKNICAISRERGVPTEVDFLSINTALNVLVNHGRADVITATNVFAHVDNVREFILSAKIILHFNGVLVLEFPYLIDYIEGLEYNTTYHEHLSYMSITPLDLLCKETGMKIISVEKQNIHCGTVRVTIAHSYSSREVDSSVPTFLSVESDFGYTTIEMYKEFDETSKENAWAVVCLVDKLNMEDKKVACFAASAKGNTLLNLCGYTSNDIIYIVDDTPEKQGKFSPGTGIPILPVDELKNNPPDYLLILAWNFTDEIMARVKDIYKGKFIIPVPTVQIR